VSRKDIVGKLQDLVERWEAKSGWPRPEVLFLDEVADRIRQLEADVSALDADARRWRYARQFLTIDDVEGWQSDTWAGHVPSGLESERADAAVDEALSRNA
jgi:hypothetical protein